MNRLFSIRRRRPFVVDMLANLQPGANQYEVSWAPTFDAVFAPIIMSSLSGYLDAEGVNINTIESVPTGGNYVRIVFNPFTYGIIDTLSFWLRVTPYIGGVAQAPGAPTLVLPDKYHHGDGMVPISGTAPITPMQLDLPRLAGMIRFIVPVGTLLVAFEEGGPQIPVKGSEVLGLGTQASIYVQGAAFFASFSQVFPS
jgi:hypothetical protein